MRKVEIDWDGLNSFALNQFVADTGKRKTARREEWNLLGEAVIQSSAGWRHTVGLKSGKFLAKSFDETFIKINLHHHRRHEDVEGA